MQRRTYIRLNERYMCIILISARLKSVANCNLSSTPQRKSTRTCEHDDELSSSRTILEIESPKAHVRMSF